MYILKKANIFDPLAETHNPRLFSGDNLIPEARLGLLEAIQQFINVPIIDAYLLGSIVGYQYSEKTDIDMWVVVEDPGMTQILGKNGVLLPGTLHPINMKMMKSSELAPSKDVWPVTYSVFKDEWIKRPTKPTLQEISIFNEEMPYLNMVKREMDRQTNQMYKAEGSPRLLKEVRDVTNIYKNLDRSRKMLYRLGVRNKKKNIRNATYKYIERETILGANAATLERFVRKVLDKRDKNVRI